MLRRAANAPMPDGILTERNVVFSIESFVLKPVKVSHTISHFLNTLCLCLFFSLFCSECVDLLYHPFFDLICFLFY